MPTFDLHQPAGIDQSLVLSSPRPTGVCSLTRVSYSGGWGGAQIPPPLEF